MFVKTGDAEILEVIKENDLDDASKALKRSLSVESSKEEDDEKEVKADKKD